MPDRKAAVYLTIWIVVLAIAIAVFVWFAQKDHLVAPTPAAAPAIQSPP